MATRFSRLITFPPQIQFPVPQLVYTSRSWLQARLFSQNCDTRQRIASRTSASLRQRLVE